MFLMEMVNKDKTQYILLSPLLAVDMEVLGQTVIIHQAALAVLVVAVATNRGLVLQELLGKEMLEAMAPATKAAAEVVLVALVRMVTPQCPEDQEDKVHQVQLMALIICMLAEAPDQLGLMRPWGVLVVLAVVVAVVLTLLALAQVVRLAQEEETQVPQEAMVESRCNQEHIRQA
jgi:hypothetical protein